jgi:hypothetical protein
MRGGKPSLRDLENLHMGSERLHGAGKGGGGSRTLPSSPACAHERADIARYSDGPVVNITYQFVILAALYYFQVTGNIQHFLTTRRNYTAHLFGENEDPAFSFSN